MVVTTNTSFVNPGPKVLARTFGTNSAVPENSQAQGLEKLGLDNLEKDYKAQLERLYKLQGNERDTSLVQDPTANEEKTESSIDGETAKPKEGILDAILNPVRDKALAFQAEHKNNIKSFAGFGTRASIAANASSLAESEIKATGVAGELATNASLIVTGGEGALEGLKKKDFWYALGKSLDALVGATVKREWQFVTRIGPAMSNLSTAIRQKYGIEEFESFSEGLVLGLKEMATFVQKLPKMGFSAFKSENADESNAYSGGGPLISMIGSLGNIVSFLPILIPEQAKIPLRVISYPFRTAGASMIDFFEGLSQDPKSQFSGAAKVDFLAGASFDILNKGSMMAKWYAKEKLGLDEDSAAVKALDFSETFFKNLGPTFESIGRGLTATAVDAGLSNDQYRVQGFKGIFSRYIESHMQSLFGVQAKGNSPAQIAELQAKSEPVAEESGLEALLMKIEQTVPDLQILLQPLRTAVKSVKSTVNRFVEDDYVSDLYTRDSISLSPQARAPEPSKLEAEIPKPPVSIVPPQEQEEPPKVEAQDEKPEAEKTQSNAERERELISSIKASPSMSERTKQVAERIERDVNNRQSRVKARENSNGSSSSDSNSQNGFDYRREGESGKQGTTESPSQKPPVNV